MSYYSDPQLEAMMADLESDRAERKESFKGDAPQKVREAVCAFANDLAAHGEPGVVLIGVRDDGTPLQGFAVTDELLRQLADIKTDGNIVPPPSLLVEKRLLQGSEATAITVENFGQLGITDYRNPNLAEALRALGYVQRFGAGIAIARKTLGQRLRFEVQPSVVAAIIKGDEA